MTRSMRIIRRPHMIDVLIPRVMGVDGYRLKWGTTFGGVPLTFLTCSNVGFRDENINPYLVDVQSIENSVRIVFDPATYSIPEDVSFWMQFVPVTTGVEGVPGAMTLVLPANPRTALVVVSGTPTGTQQIDLPYLQNMQVLASSGVSIGTEPGGALIPIPSGTGFQSLGFLGLQGTIFVSGGAFTLAGVLASPTY